MKIKTVISGIVFIVFVAGFSFAEDAASAYLPPPSMWGDATQVDEPESAYDSIGRTLRHFGHNADLIVRFHDFLRTNNVAPESLLDAKCVPPKDMRRILIEPEQLEKSKLTWTPSGDWISAKPARYGPVQRLPLKIDRGGLYRCWIRYMGYKESVAVSSFTLYRAGQEKEAPLLMEEFHTRVVGSDGPSWHEFMVDLEVGDYTMVLEFVVRYYQTAASVPYKSHEVDCIYLTDELWRDAPSDEARSNLCSRVTPQGCQRTDMPLLADAEKKLWMLWQVRPSHWETAKANPRLFALSYNFWERELDRIAGADYTAEPRDPVRTDIADYRDPRRQVVFDPIWNMLANPYRLRKQQEILKGDIDPAAKDAVYDWIQPGRFPVVTGQWQRSGGGLTAADNATKGLAAGVYTVPEPGRWHLWVQFKNINYFEYFGIYADSLFGRAAKWERTERLYPGGRGAWAKVGSIEIPVLSEAETSAHRAAAAKGSLVVAGKPVFAVTQGEWTAGEGYLEGSGTTNRIIAESALNPTNDFHVRARLSLTGLTNSGAAFIFRASNDVSDNTIQFEGHLKGDAFGTKTNFSTAGLQDGVPFDFELVRQGGTLKILLNGTEVSTAAIADAPGGLFGLQPGQAVLRLYDFSAMGGIDDGLDLRRQINIGIWMDKYINARTFRGVYALFITDDEDYQPEGSLQPKPSPRRYFKQMESVGFTANKGYVLNVAPGIGLINQTWMPGPEPESPVIELNMARDTMRSAGLMFRSGQDFPVTLKITAGPLKKGWKSYQNAVRWRAVAFAPYGDKREEWTPFFLLRRPFLTLPPLAPAQAWLTVDSTGIPPGTYESLVELECAGASTAQSFERRTVTVRVRISDVRVEPETPILLHGWVNPPAGEGYLLDWFKRFNVWQGPFFTKAEMEKYGLKLQICPLRIANEKQIKNQIALATEKGLGYDDWMFSVADEPTGLTPQALALYIECGKMIRAIDPNVKITMNPGEAARAATFKILQPYVDLWNPYLLHLSYGPSGRDYLQKPWIWYTTPCYQDKTPGIAREMYNQIRSVLEKPGDCRGTAFFAPYYPWRDPWDTAYEHIRDVSVFVLPSRYGPVATPAWEAIREAVQDANLAQMVRERAKPDDAEAKTLWEKGSVDNLLIWLEKKP